MGSGNHYALNSDTHGHTGGVRHVLAGNMTASMKYALHYWRQTAALLYSAGHPLVMRW